MISFSSLFAQDCTLEERYWMYRKNLNEKFVKVDFGSLNDGFDDSDGIGALVLDAKGNPVHPPRFTQSGFSVPANAYLPAGNQLDMNGDGTVGLGQYFAMLATEYKMLSVSGQTAQANHTCGELFLALQALRRLDMLANQFIKKEGEIKSIKNLGTTIKTPECDDEIDINKGLQFDGFSGLFFRNDAAWNENIGNETRWDNAILSGLDAKRHTALVQSFGNNIPNPVPLASEPSLFDIKDTNGPNGFTSQDQIYSLIFGLNMILSMMPNPPVSECEKEVVEKSKALMTGLIAYAFNGMDLAGCWFGKDVQKGMYPSFFYDKLWDIAKKNDIVEGVKAKLEGSGSGAALLTSDFFGQGCKGKQFNKNFRLRLYACDPDDNSGIKLSSNDLVSFTDFAMTNDKAMYAAAGLLMNQTKYSKESVKKSLEAFCDPLKAQLDKAPCCGSCANCATDPVGVKSPWDVDDVWAFSYACDHDIDEDSPVGIIQKQEAYHNGIDFMLGYNTYKLTCGSQNGNIPTLIEPNPLPTITGCENFATLSILGNNVICTNGQSNIFKLSMINIPQVPPSGTWRIDNVLIPNSNGTQSVTLPPFVNPVNGSTHTITYSFNQWSNAPNVGSVAKTISKTFTLTTANPTLTIQQENFLDFGCKYAYVCNALLTGEYLKVISPNGTKFSIIGNSVTFLLDNKGFTAQIQKIGACGTVQVSVNVPAMDNTVIIPPPVIVDTKLNEQVCEYIVSFVGEGGKTYTITYLLAKDGYFAKERYTSSCGRASNEIDVWIPAGPKEGCKYQKIINNGNTESHLGWIIYPNPIAAADVYFSNASTNLENTETLINILDFNGKVILSEKCVGYQHRINFGGLHIPNGQYIVHFQSGISSEFKKIIIQK